MLERARGHEIQPRRVHRPQPRRAPPRCHEPQRQLTPRGHAHRPAHVICRERRRDGTRTRLGADRHRRGRQQQRPRQLTPGRRQDAGDRGRSSGRRRRRVVQRWPRSPAARARPASPERSTNRDPDPNRNRGFRPNADDRPAPNPSRSHPKSSRGHSPASAARACPARSAGVPRPSPSLLGRSCPTQCRRASPSRNHGRLRRPSRGYRNHDRSTNRRPKSPSRRRTPNRTSKRLSPAWAAQEPWCHWPRSRSRPSGTLPSHRRRPGPTSPKAWPGSQRGPASGAGRAQWSGAGPSLQRPRAPRCRPPVRSSRPQRGRTRRRHMPPSRFRARSCTSRQPARPLARRRSTPPRTGRHPRQNDRTEGPAGADRRDRG